MCLYRRPTWPEKFKFNMKSYQCENQVWENQNYQYFSQSREMWVCGSLHWYWSGKSDLLGMPSFATSVWIGKNTCMHLTCNYTIDIQRRVHYMSTLSPNCLTITNINLLSNGFTCNMVLLICILT
jgi:hypothetical protein